MVTIYTYINEAREIYLGDLFDAFKVAMEPGMKISMIDISDIDDISNDEAIVIYGGEGSDKEVKEALIKTIKEGF